MLLLHLLAKFMGTCVEIYSPLHLESFFIVVMLTLKEHTKYQRGHISHTGALPVNSNPAAFNMRTHMKDGERVALNVQKAHIPTHPRDAKDFCRSAGLKGLINVSLCSWRINSFVLYLWHKYSQ